MQEEECEEWSAYLADGRAACRYGPLCYRRNPQHLAAYKHPPRKRRATPAPGPAPARRRTSGSVTIESQSSDRDESSRSPNKVKSPEFPGQAKSPQSPPSPPQTESPQSSPRAKSPYTRTLKPDALPSSSPSAPTSPFFNTKASSLNTAGHKNNTLEFWEGSNNWREIIKRLFLLDMPEDFYDFAKFYSENGNAELLNATGLEVIGPLELPLGRLPRVDDPERYLAHWRFYYDPPEFQAVLKKSGSSEFHIGYFRDAPDEMPVFLGSNDSSKNSIISPISDNIFGTLFLYLQSEKKKSPFTAMKYQKLMDKLKIRAEDLKYPLQQYNTRKRVASTAVTKTFHGAGIVVPYNKSTQLGYRPLAEDDPTIRKYFAQLSSAKTKDERDRVLSLLQPVITFANIAMDECDFGTGLELGVNLFCSGLPQLDATTLTTLTNAYSLLKRDVFGKIIQVHMKYRRKGADLSVAKLL